MTELKSKGWLDNISWAEHTYDDLYNFICNNSIQIDRLPILYKERLLEYFVNYVRYFNSFYFKDHEHQLELLGIDLIDYSKSECFDIIINKFDNSEFKKILNGQRYGHVDTKLFYNCAEEIRNFQGLLDYYLELSEKNWKDSVN